MPDPTTVLLVRARRGRSAVRIRPHPFDVRFRIVELPPGPALELCVQSDGRRPQAVVADLDGMADAGILELVGRLTRRCDVPVLAVGGVGVQLEVELAALGVVDHLPSGVPPDRLAARLLVVLDRHRSDRELLRGYLAFRSVFNHLEVPHVITDRHGRIEQANPAFYDLLGYGPDDADLTVAAITHPEDRHTLDLLAEVVAGTRDRYSVRKRCLTADGRTVWCDASVVVFRDPLAGDFRLIAQLRNVSNHVAARHELDRTRVDLATVRETYRRLFDHSPLPALILDVDFFRFLSANQAAADLFDYGREELMELAPETIWETPEQLKGQGRRLLAEDRDLPPMRARLRHRDGHLLEVEVTSVRIDHLGRAARILLLREDAAGRLPSEPQSSGPAGDARALRVLVIDDDDAVRFVIEEMLHAEGHTVLSAGSSGEALETLTDEPPFDLIIADATLPGLSSRDLQQRLGRRGSPRILVVSGYLNDTLTARGLLGRDVPFLTKPFTTELLLRKIREIFES